MAAGTHPTGVNTSPLPLRHCVTLLALCVCVCVCVCRWSKGYGGECQVGLARRHFSVKAGGVCAQCIHFSLSLCTFFVCITTILGLNAHAKCVCLI